MKLCSPLNANTIREYTIEKQYINERSKKIQLLKKEEIKFINMDNLEPIDLQFNKPVRNLISQNN